MYISYSVKGIQIAVFTWLLIILTYRRCKDAGNKHLILICVLAILNGCFAMIRVDGIDPVTEDEKISSLQTEDGYEVIFCLESICFVGAMWFYSIKYYETAQVLKHLLINTEQRSQYLTPQRKRNCMLFRWLAFTFYTISLMLQSLAVMGRDQHPDVSKALYIYGFAIISIMIVVITTLISMSLYRFVRLVSGIGGENKYELNIFPVLLQILGLLIWTGGWIATGVIFTHFYSNLDEGYEPLRKVIIIDIVSFVANLFVFMIMAYVLYKSSKNVIRPHDPALKQDVSLLVYMRN